MFISVTLTRDPAADHAVLRTRGTASNILARMAGGHLADIAEVATSLYVVDESYSYEYMTLWNLLLL